MKYEELPKVIWVKDPDTSYIVVWYDERDTILHKLRWGSMTWEQATEMARTSNPDTLIIHPDSPMLEHLEPEEPPPDEVIRKLEDYREKKIVTAYGAPFCPRTCNPLKVAIESILNGVIHAAVRLGCPVDRLHDLIDLYAGVELVDVKNLDELAAVTKKLADQIGKGGPFRVAMSLRQPPEDPKVGEGG